MDELEQVLANRERPAAVAQSAASLAHVGLIVGAFVLGWLFYKRTRR